MPDLIHNERIKLLAGNLDRASTATFTVGVATPVAALVTGLAPASLSTGTVAGFALISFVLAIALHIGGQLVLRNLHDG